MMLIHSNERKVPYDEDEHTKMVNQLKLSHFLVEHGYKLLSLLSQLIKSILLFEDLYLGLSTSSLWLLRTSNVL